MQAKETNEINETFGQLLEVNHTGVEQAGQEYPAGAVCGGKPLICETKQFVCIISKISKRVIQYKVNQLTQRRKLSALSMRECASTHTQATQPSSLRISPLFDTSMTKAAFRRPVIFSIYYPFRVSSDLQRNKTNIA